MSESSSPGDDDNSLVSLNTTLKDELSELGDLIKSHEGVVDSEGEYGVGGVSAGGETLFRMPPYVQFTILVDLSTHHEILLDLERQMNERGYDLIDQWQSSDAELSNSRPSERKQADHYLAVQYKKVVNEEEETVDEDEVDPVNFSFTGEQFDDPENPDDGSPE